MVETNQLFRAQSGHGVGSPLIIAELDLGHGGSKQFDDCANLTANKPLIRNILQHGNFG